MLFKERTSKKKKGYLEKKNYFKQNNEKMTQKRF